MRAARCLVLANFGIASAARIAITTTTISSSINVKPRRAPIVSSVRKNSLADYFADSHLPKCVTARRMRAPGREVLQVLHADLMSDYQQTAVPLGVVAGMPVGIAALPW